MNSVMLKNYLSQEGEQSSSRVWGGAAGTIWAGKVAEEAPEAAQEAGQGHGQGRQGIQEETEGGA